jgi:adenine/guanine phosphoribosyltransferase-like PRPP-binding protein
VERQVSQPCELVVPISLYEIPSQLHRELRHYKSGAIPSAELEFGTHVAALVGYFLDQHGECIERAAEGGWDVITTVPSSGVRAGEHPLAHAIRRVGFLKEHYELLLDKGSVDLDHNRASDDGFVLRRELDGERVLLIDDTFTSGARAQSAASVINNGGGAVVAILAIGRVIDPSSGDHVKEYWDRQRRQLFSFDTCCLE